MTIKYNLYPSLSQDKLEILVSKIEQKGYPCTLFANELTIDIGIIGPEEAFHLGTYIAIIETNMLNNKHIL